MTSIPVAICKYSHNKFKRHDLKKERFFLDFFIEFLKWAWNLKISEKKEEYSSLILTEIISSERDVYLSV